MPARPHLPIIPLLIAAALVVSGFFAFSTARNAVRNYQLREDERALKTELRQLDADREELTAVRDYLASDEYVEDVARRVLGLVRPGETLVIVTGREPAPSPTAATHPLGQPWWKDLFIAPAATPTPPAPDAASP